MRTSKLSTHTSSVANNGIVLFGEGYTEYYFYDRCINTIANASIKKPAVIKIKNVEGFGNFIHYPRNCLKGFILPNNKGIEFTVFLCYDTDVFELQRQPSINWGRVIKEIKFPRVTNAICIEQKYSIEDWILKDLRGVLDYLKLPYDVPIPTGRGIDVLKSLYKKADNIYVHGEQRDSKKLVNSLDFDLIIVSIWDEIQSILTAFNIHDKSIFK